MKQREATDILEIKLNILHKLFAFIYNSKTVQEKLSEVTKEEEDLLVSHNVDLLAFLAKIEDMHNEGSSELEALLRQECLEELAKIRNPLYEEIADITLQTDDQAAKLVATNIIEMIDNLQ